MRRKPPHAAHHSKPSEALGFSKHGSASGSIGNVRSSSSIDIGTARLAYHGRTTSGKRLSRLASDLSRTSSGPRTIFCQLLIGTARLGCHGTKVEFTTCSSSSSCTTVAGCLGITLNYWGRGKARHCACCRRSSDAGRMVNNRGIGV